MPMRSTLPLVVALTATTATAQQNNWAFPNP